MSFKIESMRIRPMAGLPSNEVLRLAYIFAIQSDIEKCELVGLTDSPIEFCPRTESLAAIEERVKK